LRTAIERSEVRQQIAEQDLARHHQTINSLGELLGKTIEKLKAKLGKATRDYDVVSGRALAVERKYLDAGLNLPTPFLARDRLTRLQEQAIGYGLVSHVESLEKLRVALAHEHNQPVRNDEEAARLVAQLFTARAELGAKQERAAGFDQTRHLQRWQIGKEKWSLADLDRQLERQTDRARAFGKYNFHLNPHSREQASVEATRLLTVREEVIKKIEERRNELRGEVGEARKLVEVLARIHDREAANRSIDGRRMPAPEFTREELRRVEASAIATRDAGLLRQLNEFERAPEAERATSGERLRRSMAREAMAEVALRESAERLAAFEERGDVQPLAVQYSDERLTVHRRQETKPSSVIERVLRPLVEKLAAREHRLAIEAAAANTYSRLVADHEKSRSYYEAAREIAEGLHKEMQGRTADKIPVTPEFTAKEQINLEIYAERQADPQARDHYLRLARGEAVTGLGHGVQPGYNRQAEPSPVHDAHTHFTGRGR